MSSKEKRKHTTLSLVQKKEVINKLEKGATLVQLATEYGVGRATIYDIKKNKEKIVGFINKNDDLSTKRQTLKTGENPLVEECVFAWFLQERRRHAPLSGEMIREKARYFYKEITEKDDFQASKGWLEKFQKRHGIRMLTFTGEKLSCDESAVEPYKQKFLKTVSELKLGPDQVYNADESGLFWRLLPKKTLAHRSEASAPGRKVSKERITFMPCANASGKHKLDLLVIGKAKSPRAFKNVNLPVIYTNQNRGWMMKSLFLEWFHKNFVPAVRKFLKGQNLPEKALLILDNCPGHPDESELKTSDGSIQTLFLPPNVTPILQPMDQNVIQTIKMNYKKSLLYGVLNSDKSIVQSLKEVNLKDVVFNLQNAWEKVSTKTIVCSWGNVWPDLSLLKEYKKQKSNAAGNSLASEDDLSVQEKNENERELNELQKAIAPLCGDEEETLTITDINSWFVGNPEENIQIMSDKELIEEIVNQEDLEEEIENNQEPVRSVNVDSAIAAFKTSIKWAEENGETAQDILVLKRLYDNVVKKSFKCKKQKTINSFFVRNEPTQAGE